MSLGRIRLLAPTERGRRRLAAAAAIGLLSGGLSACEGGETSADPGAAASSSEAAVPEFRLRSSVPDGRDVPVDHAVSLTAKGGSLTSVTVTSSLGELAGALKKDGSAWTARGRLEPGLDYRVHAVGERSDGKKVVRDATFHTADLTLDEQTYASVAPLQGETVGVGMPVIVTFDVPVTDRASIEKQMSVTASPRQPGSWHWLNSQEVHWRPRTYWRAGSDVSVDLAINSVAAGGGVFGQEDRHIDFQIGDAHVYKVNAQTHQM